jgi:hypothetical protein
MGGAVPEDAPGRAEGLSVFLGVVRDAVEVRLDLDRRG